MIVQHKTPHVLPHSKMPGWGSIEPESGGDTVWCMSVGLFFGGVAGFVLALGADLAFLNGAGMSASTEAEGSQIAPFFIIPPIISIICMFILAQVLPRVFKPKYFSNPNHRDVYVKYMKLDVTQKSFAQEAYDAVAAFDAPFNDSRYGTEQCDLYREALQLWEKTYETLRTRELGGDAVSHKERILAAKNALETI